MKLHPHQQLWEGSLVRKPLDLREASFSGSLAGAAEASEPTLP